MKKFILLLIAFALCSGAAKADDKTYLQTSTKAERNYVHQGNKCFNDSNYHAALQCYERALALNPNSPYALYNKALTLVQLSDDNNKGKQNDPRPQALQIFDQLMKDKANYPELAAKSAYNLGNMMFNDDQLDKAIECYKESLRIVPDNKKARQNLLIALMKKQQQEQNKDQQQNQDQDKDKQDQQQQQQDQQQQQQNQQQEQRQQQPKPEEMSQNAAQILQSVQNKENSTRRRNQAPATGRPYTDKPW